MRRAAVALVAFLAAACSGNHSALAPAGPQSARIGSLWWVMFWVSIAVWVLVMAAVFTGVWRARREDARALPPDVDRERWSSPKLTGIVGVATAVTIAVLFVLLGYSAYTGRRVAAFGAPSALTINVTGHQWWWEIQYSNPIAYLRVTTANEIHIPTGRPVVLNLTSTDVIHSFWVPSLHGKRDLIPGYVTAFWIQADQPGVYRGQCAEYCGTQHANMAFEVVAESPANFRAWLEHQRQPAAQPGDEVARHGEQVFLSGPCVQCHTIRGTTAGATVAPDLTHLASRRLIAAGTLPNTRGNLAGWIVDPQTVKPGNHMPPNGLQSDDLQALLTYLQGLK